MDAPDVHNIDPEKSNDTHDHDEARTQGKVSMGEYLGTPVAIKTVAQRRLKYTNNQIRLINRELKVLGSLRHPNVVLAIGACQEPKVYHIVMEYVSGHNLVIHRDINPENIMCTIDCRVKLCDMGVSKFQQNSLMTTVGVIAKGTSLYISPELLTEEKIESSTFSDVWATACTIVELYNEALVWEIDEETEQLINVIERKKIPDVVKVPVKIKSQLLTCFSKKPKERSLSGLLHEYSKLSKSQYK
ncbi:probable serine/threonine-protein kinase DDB_G0281745 [Aphidius gifuensis]|uniref:probable serine/threonine-protein kinase DDB_G0281745 n=1 Tax=Aphidius gifuensis TaxID=684658 RepID=UPI001CDC5C49|nr:probable serine/threonine-protein kinase DDB_G0281745 [Aphidius gifuensis]